MHLSSNGTTGSRRQQTSPAVWNRTLNYILP